MLLPDLSQLLSFSSSSSGFAGLFGAQTGTGEIGSLFGGLGTGAEGIGQSGLFGGLKAVHDANEVASGKVLGFAQFLLGRRGGEEL